jgi:hypothetical protein
MLCHRHSGNFDFGFKALKLLVLRWTAIGQAGTMHTDLTISVHPYQ